MFLRLKIAGKVLVLYHQGILGSNFGCLEEAFHKLTFI